ncbi:MAG TPA: iron ABC transporter permease [Clostridiaceae bacterium]|nr:iron ABC transporter permease [Clostridiaceae bacterium]
MERQKSKFAATKRTGARHPIFILLVILVAVFLLALSVGKYPVSIDALWSSLWAQLTRTKMDTGQLALIRVRLPRTILAVVVGGSLSLSGAVYQGLFKNPVVSPDLLGASNGASFGAALSILWGASAFGIQITAFLGGLVAVALVAMMNRLVSRRSHSIVNLILCGMLVSSLFNALVSFTKFVADTETKLPAITFWLMGSLSSVKLTDLRVCYIFLPVTVLLLAVRWKVNILSLGDDEARMLGVNVGFYRGLIIACATLLTSLSVSVSGNIGWVGLVVPHFARMVVGSNYGTLLPASLLIGGSYMLLVDTVARLLLTVEIPLSIITAIVGAPFFFILLLRARKGFV